MSVENRQIRNRFTAVEIAGHQTWSALIHHRLDAVHGKFRFRHKLLEYIDIIIIDTLSLFLLLRKRAYCSQLLAPFASKMIKRHFQWKRSNLCAHFIDRSLSQRRATMACASQTICFMWTSWHEFKNRWYWKVLMRRRSSRRVFVNQCATMRWSNRLMIAYYADCHCWAIKLTQIHFNLNRFLESRMCKHLDINAFNKSPVTKFYNHKCCVWRTINYYNAKRAIKQKLSLTESTFVYFILFHNCMDSITPSRPNE